MSRFALFDAGLVNVLRGDLAALVHDELRTPVTYAVTVESIEQDDGRVEATLTDGSRRRVDMLVGPTACSPGYASWCSALSNASCVT